MTTEPAPQPAAVKESLTTAQPEAKAGADGLCSDCPPAGYPTDETRCVPCPRRSQPKPAEGDDAAKIAAEIAAYAQDAAQCFDAQKWMWAIRPEMLIDWSRRVACLTAKPAGSGEAVGYVAQDGSVIWYTENFGAVSLAPKPGTLIYTSAPPAADAEALAAIKRMDECRAGCDAGDPFYADVHAWDKLRPLLVRLSGDAKGGA